MAIMCDRMGQKQKYMFFWFWRNQPWTMLIDLKIWVNFTCHLENSYRANLTSWIYIFLSEIQLGDWHVKLMWNNMIQFYFYFYLVSYSLSLNFCVHQIIESVLVLKYVVPHSRPRTLAYMHQIYIHIIFRLALPPPNPLLLSLCYICIY